MEIYNFVLMDSLDWPLSYNAWAQRISVSKNSTDFFQWTDIFRAIQIYQSLCGYLFRKYQFGFFLLAKKPSTNFYITSFVVLSAVKWKQ